jgi:hypothetical protein
MKKRCGMDVEIHQIVSLTGLSVEEIEKIEK